MSGEDLCSFVELRFYDRANTRLNRTLPEALGISFTDELAADGRASYTAPLLAQALKVSPDLLEDGFCKAAMVLVSGQPPVEVFGWELVPTSGTVVAEPGQKQVTPSAPGLRHLFEYGILHPESGGYDINTEDARLLGWMSKQSTYWYDPTDWVTPFSNGNVKVAGKTVANITADTTPAIGDVMLFRTTITLAAPAYIRFIIQCDDMGSLYVDSKLAVTTDNARALGYKVLYLGAGTHTVAVEVQNTIAPLSGLSALITRVDNNQVIRLTDTTHWKTHKVVSGVKPGMSIGAILRTCLDEAQSTYQSVYGLNLLTPDFDGQHDSAGVAWPELHEQSFPLGSTTFGDVVRHMEELGCDVHIKPDFTFQAFLSQGADHHTTVAFRPGGNLLGLTYEGQPVRATTGVVRTQSGWQNVSDSAGVTAYGKRWIGIISGTSVSAAQGAKLGARMLQESASPRYHYTATLRAVVGCVPFQDFKKGDLVTCPDRTGANVSMRVLSITPSTPSDTAGPVTFTVELDLP